MPKFSDSKGREWIVDIDAFLHRKVRECLGVDLSDPESYQKLGKDLVKAVNVLYMLVRDARPDVTDEDFGRSLKGDAIHPAIDSLNEAIVLFARPDQRDLLNKALQKEREVGKKAKELAIATMDGPEAAEALEDRLKDIADDYVRRLREKTPKTLASSSPD